MNPENIFSISGTLAMAGWIILIALPFWRSSDKFITGIIVTLFAIVYSWLIFSAFHWSDFSKFGTLDGVSNLFENRNLLLAGWIHYLAFDLMTGMFIVRNARIYSIPHLLLAPCLLLTFMLGPMGLLLFLLLRSFYAKKYFADNA